MTFQTEPTYYIKGAFSDLQGAWACLRNAIVNLPPSKAQHQLIFHVDEGMSWESVRDLEKMAKTLLLVSNIIQQADVSKDVHDWAEEVRESFRDLMCAIKNGETL